MSWHPGQILGFLVRSYDLVVIMVDLDLVILGSMGSTLQNHRFRTTFWTVFGPLLDPFLEVLRGPNTM
jgi:hypothetical protein